MKQTTAANLLSLAAHVESKLAEIERAPRPTSSSWRQRQAAWKRERKAGKALLAALERDEGAFYRDTLENGGFHILAMAGVRTTCTSGELGVLRNWVNAARRRVAKARRAA